MTATIAEIREILDRTARRDEEYRAEAARRDAEYKARDAEYKARDAEYKARDAEYKAAAEKRDVEWKLERTEMDRRMEEASAKTERKIKAVSKQLGGIVNSNGASAENYFYNSIKKSKMFGNETFDYAVKNVRGRTQNFYDEYDIVLYNGNSIGIIEVKYNAQTKDITQTIDKAATFRQLFPVYKDFTFYLGLASFVFDEDIEKAALDAGLAVIKQVGKTMVVQDERVKKF